jgi:hypothetical protein
LLQIVDHYYTKERDPDEKMAFVVKVSPADKEFNNRVYISHLVRDQVTTMML